MIKLKVGDKVKVQIGKDAGREGIIEKIDHKKGLVYIPDINVYKRHVKGGMQEGQKGGVYELPRPLAVSKVALICPKCKKITRISYKFIGKEKKRVCAKCKREIDSKEVKSKKK